MLLSAASDNTVCVWDLAVERDAEEEAQAMAENESNAEIPDDLPPQLMFVHQGITDPKEAKFHSQIPGLIVSTALDGFHAFKPFNVGPET
jgi:ribosome assembly protein RRB1